MDDPDLNLLPALDALLAEGSVTAAARRLGLSVSAASRALSRLRDATGDPLLVRAGAGLVATPHARELQSRIGRLAEEARAVLRPRPPSSPAEATAGRSLTLRVNPSFLALLSVPLLDRVARDAPGLRLRFAPKPDRDAAPLRDGRIDLEIGVLATAAPELRTRPLFRDSLVGIARARHPRLADSAPTAPAIAAERHVVASPDGTIDDEVDCAFRALGLDRDIRAIVPGFSDAIRIVRHSDLIGFVPRSCLGNALVGEHPDAHSLHVFEPPFAPQAFQIRAIWHPRLDADPAHRWLRDAVTALCHSAYGTRSDIRSDGSI